MEKLQKALKKARAERESRVAKAPAPKPEPAPAPAPAVEDTVRAPAPKGSSRMGRAGRAAPSAGFPAIWDALLPFEPDPKLLTRNRVLTFTATHEAAPFDILRTKIFLMMRQNGWTRLAITSPDKGCGKTTVACNLALAFSRQREVKTVLFDLDLRRPGVSHMLGHTPDFDVGKLLTRDVAPEDQMVRLRSNLAIAMARRAVSDPTQLLLSPATAHSLDRIEKQFEPDLMLFDLPPMLVTDDARAVLKMVDCALIVVRADQTKTAQLDVCETEVAEHTNVAGIVLNNCRHMSDEGSYYDEYA